MKVEIWSDVVCPCCYVGKRRFEAALAAFQHADDVEVTWRSFELDPRAPAEREGDYVSRLAAKYEVSAVEAQAMVDRMTDSAATEGISMRFDLARPGNTFAAHRLIHLAGERGVQDAVKERLLAATFTDGEPIGDRDTLVRLGADAGLDADEARSVLETDAYADDVRADERQAAAFGISAVPFFVIARTYGISGAQPAPVLRSALERAWAESHPTPLTAVGATGDAGPGCEGDSCAV